MEQFDILQTLGRGSFGVVRKVRRKADGKALVVKEMDYGAADEKQKEQIVAEVWARHQGEGTSALSYDMRWASVGAVVVVVVGVVVVVLSCTTLDANIVPVLYFIFIYKGDYI